MKGVVFILLGEVVRREHGEAAWDALLERAGAGGVYTSLGSYPDAEFFRLVRAASDETGRAPADLIRWFGREAQGILSGRYPEFFAPHAGARAFVLTLNDIIHPEVRKLYPGADVPDFGFDTSDPETLRMSYHSERAMCTFAEGLIEGAALHYGQRAEIAQPRCMHYGDDHCLLEVRFHHDPA